MAGVISRVPQPVEESWFSIHDPLCSESLENTFCSLQVLLNT